MTIPFIQAVLMMTVHCSQVELLLMFLYLRKLSDAVVLVVYWLRYFERLLILKGVADGSSFYQRNVLVTCTYSSGSC